MRLNISKLLRLLALAACILALGGAGRAADEGEVPAVPYGGSADTHEESPRLYLAYNQWYEKPDHLYSVNYKKGKVIPAGTEILRYRILDDEEIEFTTVDNRTYTMEFQAKFTNLKIGDFARRMFTPKNFRRLTEWMSRREVECIRAGVIKIGMCKEAVLVAYGYPPEHQTPSLRASVWYFWVNRFAKKAIYFDENGDAMRNPNQDPDTL